MIAYQRQVLQLIEMLSLACGQEQKMWQEEFELDSTVLLNGQIQKRIILREDTITGQIWKYGNTKITAIKGDHTSIFSVCNLDESAIKKMEYHIEMMRMSELIPVAVAAKTRDSENEEDTPYELYGIVGFGSR
ncbi:hypothetical protein lbkm_4023 [Lachnospiraceae bacterium KM106-2]|nr:hypothetical protein lbkm_4023 [Lachnospiraceae bacterium KM106-2]